MATTEAPDRLLLLDAASGRIRHVLRGHDDRVRSLVFSHDGRSVASSSWDRTGIIWDVATGGVRERLRLGEGAVAIAFGPDDTTLYSSGEDRAIRVWDLQGSRRFLVTAVEPQAFPSGTHAPAPGGRFVSSWFGMGLRFFDVAEGRWSRAVGEGRFHHGTAWNASGTLVASVGKGFLKVWDPASAEVVRETRLDGVFAAVGFSPDDTTIAVMSTEGELSSLTRQPSSRSACRCSWRAAAGRSHWDQRGARSS